MQPKSVAGGRQLNDLIDVALDQMAKGQLDAWQMDSRGWESRGCLGHKLIYAGVI